MANQRSRVVAGVTVAVVLAVGVAVTIVLLSRGGGGVELPDEVDGVLARDADAAVPDDGERKDEILAAQRDSREQVAERYADAYDGADADVRSYGDVGEEDSPTYAVLAIELDAGPLLPERFLDDPELVGYAVPQTEVVTEGDAECVLTRTQPPVAGSDHDEEDVAPDVVTCQRSSGSLTVRVVATTGPTVEDTADFLDAVWDELD